MSITHSRIQHGVGQGSFHSATVKADRADGSHYRFDYVYDCGGLSGGKFVQRGISRLDLTSRAGGNGRHVIDALVLSHYDQDHINHALELAKRFEVRHVFLPYLALEELLLVVGAIAQTASTATLRALHGVAHGHGFGGMPVTQVRGGPPNDVDWRANDVVPPEAEERRGNDNPERPRSVEVLIAGRLPGTAMSHHDDVQVMAREAEAGRHVWKLRFWNRGLDDELFVHLFDEMVAIGFPLCELADPDGFEAFLDWLQVRENRNRTAAAYRAAIRRYAPTWAGEATGRLLANFLSLAVYSGPTARVDPEFRYRRVTSVDGLPRPTLLDFLLETDRRRPHAGWIGTGDAPLGEPGVWADFSMHFAGELPTTLTILIPHHGAAPRSGPRFYNDGLNHLKGVVSVISVGKRNNYGHPMPYVIERILRHGGDLQLVTEDSIVGFHEVLWND